jgi:hypothetical protein
MKNGSRFENFPAQRMKPESVWNSWMISMQGWAKVSQGPE